MMERGETLGYRIRLIQNQIQRHMEARRSEHEGSSETALTGMQRWLIGYLKEHEGEEVCQRDIEHAFSVSRATASNMLSVMERRGLIERLSVERDARLKKLVLTERAQTMLERVEQDVKEMETLMTAGMSETEIRHLMQYLDQILANLGAQETVATRCCTPHKDARG